MTNKENGFNDLEGRIDVDYKNFLAKHDVVYNAQPIHNYESMPVANGRVGAMVWGKDKIQMEIVNVDASPHTALAQAQVELKILPTPSSENFKQRLNLYNGNISIQYGEEVEVIIFGIPHSELLGIRVKDSRKDFKEIQFNINVWPLTAQAENDSYIMDVEAWKECQPFNDIDNRIVGISKGISSRENFGYTCAAKVVGADVSARIIDDYNVQIAVESKTNDYTIYISTTSVINAAGRDSVAQATKELLGVVDKDVRKVLEESQNWWHEYWDRSFISYDDGTADGDYHENIYYLYQYLFGGAAYGTYPMHFINGVYRYDKDNSIHWSKAYWHFNERAVYNGALASNRIDAAMSYYEFYNRIMPQMQQYTKSRFEFDNGALKTTETVRWDGYPFDKNDRQQFYENNYVGWIYSTGPEVAENMYYLYKYSLDENLLERYYPYIEKTVEFIAQWARYDEGSRHYHLECSNSLENWWKVNNSTPDNAAIRSIIPKFIEVYKILNKDHEPQLVEKLMDILEKLEPITKYKDENRYAPYNLYDKAVNLTNVQNPELELIYPHSITGIGYEDYEIAVNSYWNRQVGEKISIWTVDGIQAARLGLGDEAARVLKQMQIRNQKLVCGITDDGNGVYESMGLHISTINEMYLQSYDDIIRVFPAIPNLDMFKGAFTLLASGGFLVSSEYAEKNVKYIGILSKHGGKAIIDIPWDTDVVAVNNQLMKVDEGKIEIHTEAKGRYLIEVIQNPIQDMVKIKYTGAINEGVKYLAEKTLGI